MIDRFRRERRVFLLVWDVCVFTRPSLNFVEQRCKFPLHRHTQVILHEIGDNRLDKNFAVDLEFVALDVGAVQGWGCLDPEDWSSYHRTNCLARAQWQEEWVD